MLITQFTASLDDPRVVYSLVRLAPEGVRDKGTRRPVNLVLAVDRSSSMRGPRLAQAVRAIRSVLERLDERDRLGVVVFDATARVLLPAGPVNAAARTRLEGELERLETGAGTNLAAALKKAVEVVSTGFVRDATARVVLLTDGCASVGPLEPQRLGAIAEAEVARGVTTTTMGIGEGFDDELLAEVARCGRGGFHYLATPAQIPAAFGRELAGVFSIAALGVEVKVVPEPEVSACEVLHRLPTRGASDGLVVELGDIAMGEPRQVLFRLTRTEVTPAKLLAKIAVTHREPSGQAGAPRVDRLLAPSMPIGADTAEVVLEHLRLAVASAVDEAWARRASGKRAEALAALAEVRSALAGALERKLAPEGPLNELKKLLADADEALKGAANELEHLRRVARERSHVTLLGQSVVRPVPKGPSNADED